MERKLGKPTDQRMALLRNQTSYLLWYGRIETTLDRAKEIRKLAEKMLTLAINSYTDEVKVTKEKLNVKGEKIPVEFTNDGSKRLNARRKMLSILVEVQERRLPDEKLAAYKKRCSEIKYPLIEKMFNVYAPKYAQKNASQTQGGGYTRIIRTEIRRGDNAQMVIIELV